jgi:hypothetical protein
MSFRGVRRLLVAGLACALAPTGVAAAQTDSRGVDPNQGLSLVEIDLPNKAAAMVLQIDAERYGVEFNDHYLRNNRSGTVTVSVFGTQDGFDRLAAAGYDVARTIETPRTWEQRMAERQADARQERRADRAALDATAQAEDELVVLRVDYFENYAGRFLSVEAKTRQAVINEEGNYAGPELSLSWNRGGSTPIDSTPHVMNVNVDSDTEPNTYIEHRELVRIGERGSSDPPRPSRVRIGSSTGASIEADVNTWLGGGLPPMGSRFITDFTTRYMDPTEVYEDFDQIATEYPNIAQLITLPNRTNGYQRKAQANMSGGLPSGNSPPTADQGRTVVLTSRAWGHEGGNDITAEFRHPGQVDSPLSVTFTGNDLVVNLATDGTAALTSTAAQVVAAINASAEANAKLVAQTFRGNAGAGIVLPRAKVNLSDFLATSTNAHVQRGPFKYSVLRIGKRRDGTRTGVFLYCQQHAREWATPLTCLETARQLVTNYAIDSRTKELVDNLDIFILPSANPDGSHYSIHNFASQRRNMTNYCVVGGKETDDQNAVNFWAPRQRPDNGLPYTNNDPASRNAWGVDLNRNNTAGTIFDGYIGASHSCTSDVYAGPSEASEPEMKNERWISDTFDNIKFSNNIHSFGGYFMWAPGAYLPDRGEGDLVHANIGVEKYFFKAGDRILNRIKDVRNTAILPERTGPIADVLYSAGGNSADAAWYERDQIAYSFETGADRFVDGTLSVASEPGATGIRAANRNGFAPGDRITVDKGTPNEEVRTVVAVAAQNPPSPAPNITLDAPLTLAHAVGALLGGGITQQSVGFQPDYATEGKFEALEFAAGNYGLLEEALVYAKDKTPPQVRMTGPSRSDTQIDTTFEFVNEPSVIRFTTNGKKPNNQSILWDSTGPREPGEVFHLTETTTFRWMATDIKGNKSFGEKTFRIRN